MAAHNSLSSPDGVKTLIPTSSAPPTSTMKLPQMFRRGSAMSTGEKQYEGDLRHVSVPESERRSSLSALPLRLRRRKPQPHSTQRDEEAVEAAERLGDLFFSLPSEILAQITTYLSVDDIYNLRLTSHTCHDILNTTASVVSRYCLSERFPETARPCIEDVLYTISGPSSDLSHFFRMLRRQKIVDRQIYHLLSFVQMKIYMTRTEARVLSINDNRHRLIEALQRPGWIVNHFLENYRRIVLYEHPRHHNRSPSVNGQHPPFNDVANCTTCLSLARGIIAPYALEDIMPAYHFYQLMTEHLRIATRVPPLTGKLERRLHGWNSRVPATEENLAIYLVLGGMAEVRKIAMMQGSYASRLRFVTDFVGKVREAVRTNELAACAGAGAGSGVDTGSAGGKKGKALMKFGSITQKSTSSSTNNSHKNLPPPGGPSRSNSSTLAAPPADDDDKNNDNANENDDDNDNPPSNLFDSLSPPFPQLTRQHLDSLPDLNSFFYHVWRPRIEEALGPRSPPRNDDGDDDGGDSLGEEEGEQEQEEEVSEEVTSPYPWLQRVMAGSGVDFAESRAHRPALALGASPV